MDNQSGKEGLLIDLSEVGNGQLIVDFSEVFLDHLDEVGRYNVAVAIANEILTLLFRRYGYPSGIISLSQELMKLGLSYDSATDLEEGELILIVRRGTLHFTLFGHDDDPNSPSPRNGGRKKRGDKEFASMVKECLAMEEWSPPPSGHTPHNEWRRHLGVLSSGMEIIIRSMLREQEQQQSGMTDVTKSISLAEEARKMTQHGKNSIGGSFNDFRALDSSGSVGRVCLKRRQRLGNYDDDDAGFGKVSGTFPALATISGMQRSCGDLASGISGRWVPDGGGTSAAGLKHHRQRLGSYDGDDAGFGKASEASRPFVPPVAYDLLPSVVPQG